ncbi:hypothetical protein EIP86_004674 [Pleurotus ostreatoroseus]|nr:hypothetical protein EIP86_004674 [Pleurotus ostreatoroseus]
MDDLWSILNDVSPLIKCMPESAWKVSKMPLGLGRQSPALYLADPKHDDWDYFVKHAHRVKTISVGTAGPGDMWISGFLLSAICTCAHERLAKFGPLFPNLRSLTCEIYGGECLACIPYLGGSSLSTLRVRAYSSVVTVTHCLAPLPEILARVQRNSPSLTLLDVSLYPIHSTSQPPQTYVADFLPAMTTFSSDQFSSLSLHFEYPPNLLRFFSVGKRLATLNITMQHIRLDDLHFDRIPTFPALHTLILQSCSIDVATAFLKAITTPHLHALELRCQSFCDSWAVRLLCNAISRHENLHKLTMCSMATFTASTMDRVPRFDMLDTLASLLSLSELRSFTLQGVVYVDIHDDYLISFGKAWLQLESLMLEIKPLQPTLGVALETMTLPSVHALRLIPAYFPGLISLGIPVSQKVFDPEDFHRKNETRSGLNSIFFYSSPLFHTTAEDSELLDPDKLADFLHSLFPQLRAVKGPQATGPWWPTVFSHLLTAKLADS